MTLLWMRSPGVLRVFVHEVVADLAIDTRRRAAAGLAGGERLDQVATAYDPDQLSIIQHRNALDLPPFE